MASIDSLIKNAENTKCKEAYIKLADAYCKTKDFANAALYYEKAAELGSMYGMQQIGYMYYKGYGVERSNGMAKKYLRAAADAGSVEALVDLGWMCYDENYGFLASKGKAFEFWLKASKLGHAQAQLYIANSYLTDTWGAEKSYKKAAFWFMCAYQNRKSTQNQIDEAKEKLRALSKHVNLDMVKNDVVRNHSNYLNLN